MPDICLTLAERRIDDLESKIRRYADDVPWIEIRLDALAERSIPPLPRTGCRFIACCRRKADGGFAQLTEEERLKRLDQAAAAGCGWLDLEDDVDWTPAGNSVRIIRSRHIFGPFPDSLDDTWSTLSKRPADVRKLALMVHSTRELTALLEWTPALASSEGRILIGMGELGQPSRLLGAFPGNRWTYVCESDAVAPGQFTLEQARDCYRLQRRRAPEALYGVLGHPVTHSLSPLLHNALFDRYGLNRLYLPCPVDDLSDWFDYLGRTSLPFAGFSVTLPYKTAIRRFVNEEDSRFDSINTLSRTADGWRGSNTDYAGFIAPLRRVLPKCSNAVVLGCGGVARMVVRTLKESGCAVTVVARNQERLKDFCRDLGCDGAPWGQLPVSADLCVNTTPVGQFPDVESCPLTPDQLRFRCVYDLIYRPIRTRLLRLADERGLETIGGLEMFIEQAALQFQTWTGIDPDRREMRSILKVSQED